MGNSTFTDFMKRLWRVLTRCRKGNHDIVALQIDEEDRGRWSGDLNPWCMDCGRSFPQN